MLRVDCHFHPNFSFFLPEFLLRRKARKIWREFQRRKLDAVFVSEHAFHHPVRAYRTLLRYRPRGARTFLVPAVEVLSREGVDMIVFSRDEHVYAQRDIITPYMLSIEQVARRVRADPRLFGVIVHPWAPSRSGILHHRSERFTQADIRLLGFAEKFNASLVPLRRMLAACPIASLLRRSILRLSRTIRMPADLSPRGIVVFGGSDAHHLWEMGSCLEIHTARPRTYAAAFRAIVSPRFRRTFHLEPQRLPLLLAILWDGFTAFREHLMRVLHLYNTDAPLTDPARATTFISLPVATSAAR